ncbi:MAG: penicillin-binding protein 2 [Geobacteraceae bacterium]|nr:penicillin-binding protein 2 [Geobacteraceae bacterium]
MSKQQYVRGGQDLGRRLYFLSVAAAVLFAVILTRLWFLQFIEVDRLKEMSENNRLRFIPVAASRGALIDRNGKVIVNNTPSFSLAVIPNEVTDKDYLIDNVAKVLKLDKEELLAKWEKGKGRAKYIPIILASGLTRDQVEYFEENNLRLNGLEIEVKPVREYPNVSLASHLLGYIGEVSEKELTVPEFSNYNPGDYIGKSGIERSFESYLHGDDGGRQIEVDARGRYLRTLNETLPVPGQSLVLTIDIDLQKATEKALGDKAAAVVAMDVNSGEILSFASNPGFDPALFTGRMPPEIWKQYLEDKRRPLENKALKGMYPPGSTFKMITALAGLSEGLIDENTTVNCTGEHKLGNATFRCWNKKGHGRVNLKSALRESCDVYFYQLGERLGVDKIAEYAKKFGLGEPIGIGIDGEKSGVVPTAAWKEKKTGTKWFKGETLSVSIGQGYLTATPLQLAAMTAGLANDGKIYRPHVVKKILDRDGKTLREYAPELLKNSSLKPDHLRLVKEGMLAVVNEPRGTGAAARLYEVKVAGKTGTSQVVKQKDAKMALAYLHRDHALFVAFAPYDKPEIAIAVVVEHGEHGGGAAAPVAGQILRKYFELKGVIKRPVTDSDIDESDNESDGGGD